MSSHRYLTPNLARLPATIAALALLTPLAAFDAFAAQPKPDAAALVQQNCVSCHGTEVYTRPDHRVKSLSALNTQVHMCEQNLGLKWFDEDVDAVTALLNKDYYQFKP